MGREVRRVPADWQHPKHWTGGPRGPVERFKPLHPGEHYQSTVDEWDEECAKWKTGWRPEFCTDEEDRSKAYEQWAGQRPHRDDYMPNWPDEQRTHLMMYEDTSEGTPISPAFETPEELAHRRVLRIGHARKMLRELEEDGLIRVHAYRNGGHGMAVCYEVDLQAVIDKVDPPIVMAPGELVLVHFARGRMCNNPTNNPTEFDGLKAKTTQQKVSPVLIPASTSGTATSSIGSHRDGEKNASQGDELPLPDVTSLDQPDSDTTEAEDSLPDGSDPDAWRASTADDAIPEGVIPLAEVSASVRRPRGKLVYLDAWRGAGELGSHRFAGQA